MRHAPLLLCLLLAGCSSLSEHDRAELSIAPGQRVELASAAHSSSEWRRLRNAHIKAQPACQVCGIVAKDNEVHHIFPRSTHPQFFLDPTKLITGCKRHHFWVYHGSNWRTVNTNLIESLKAFQLAAETIQR